MPIIGGGFVLISAFLLMNIEVINKVQYLLYLLVAISFVIDATNYLIKDPTRSPGYLVVRITSFSLIFCVFQYSLFCSLYYAWSGYKLFMISNILTLLFFLIWMVRRFIRHKENILELECLGKFSKKDCYFSLKKHYVDSTNVVKKDFNFVKYATAGSLVGVFFERAFASNFVINNIVITSVGVFFVFVGYFFLSLLMFDLIFYYLVVKKEIIKANVYYKI